MDTFVEQLVVIKKTWKTWMSYIGITLLSIALIFLSILLLMELAIVIAMGVAYAAYKLYGMQSVEYEYIITNSTMDIDKIVAKSYRKRQASFNLSDVQKIEKYRQNMPADMLKNCIYACNLNDNDVMVMVVKGKGANQIIVFAPNERMKEAMISFLPKHISESIT